MEEKATSVWAGLEKEEDLGRVEARKEVDGGAFRMQLFFDERIVSLQGLQQSVSMSTTTRNGANEHHSRVSLCFKDASNENRSLPPQN